MGRKQFTPAMPYTIWRWWRHGCSIVFLLMALFWPGLAQPVAAQTPLTCAAGTVGPRLTTGSPSPLPTMVTAAKFIKQTATGAATGADWDNALGSSALKSVIEAGGTVYVAAGVYAPSNVIYLGNNSKGHFVYGGFPANATGTSLAGYNPNANQTIITGSNARWLFHNVVYVQNITLQGLVLQNANGPTGSVFLGAIGDPTPVTFKFIDLLVRNNQTAGVGAFYLSAKSNPSTQILFLNSNFSGNNAVEGAAITGSGVFPGYSSSTGAINNDRLIIDGVSFANNTSTSHGGAMYVTGSHAWTIRNSSFCGNRTNIQGGAIYFTGAYGHKIENTSFSNNTSVAYGGAILGTSATMTINTSYFVGNQAGPTYAGGAISGHSAAFNLDKSYFYNNKAGAGGAIFHVSAYNSLPSKVENSVFAGNQSTYPYSSFNSSSGVGGAISVAANPNGWSFINTKFVNNSVPSGGWGGAIANHDVKSTLVNTLFFGNTVGGNATAAGSDIRQYDTSGGFQNIQDSKMQLANAAAYTNLLGGTHATAYVFTTGNTFSNADNGAVPPAPTVTCPTGLPGQFGVGAPLRNFCPVSTVNLGALHTGTTPAGATLLWSTDGDASNGLSSTSPALTANSGTYFAYYYDATNQCYSPPSVAVNVQTTSCDAFIDTDNDGINDATDLDDDNDGIPDTVEAATARNNGDTDGDGIADRIDLDSDNDGILDITESGRTTGVDANGDGLLDGPVGTDGIPDSVQPAPNGGTVNYTIVDTDGDSRPDFQDLDSDNDGINDVREANGTDTNGDGQADGPVNGNGVPGSVPAAGLTPPDTDGDGKPDFRDLDSDNDAINDIIEGGAGPSDTNGDGIADGADTDGDGIKDPVDGRAGFGDANDPTPTNSDTDATPDFRDPDSDNDGLTDLRESGANPAVDANNDGKVDDITDPDNDGIPAPVDGAPAAFGDANSPVLPDGNNNGKPDYRDPADTDNDGVPDATDLDDDNDGIPDTVEAATARNNGDTDGDGIADRIDLDSDNDGILDITESGRATGADANGDGRLDGPVGTDGIPDSVQPAPNSETINYTIVDTDGDSRPDFQDLDSDNDGINDVREAGSTGSPTLEANGDGQADSPVNGNGVPGSVPAAGLTPPDTDGDGKPDFRDLDSDNDAINDVIEGGAGSFPDANGDGIVDGADTDGDGIKDGVDGAPTAFGDANDPTPANSDTDATPDFRDPDSDNDGLTDLRESGANPAVDANNDGKVNDITDPDNDGIPAPVDGAPAAFGDANNPALPDGNNNGTPDYRDPAAPVDTDNDGVPDATDLDDDNDGIPDTTEAATARNNGDTDGDGIADRIDLDSDNDGILDITESGRSTGADANGDGRLDGPVGTDGIPDSVQPAPNGGTVNYTIVDTDGDSRPDFQDLDSDNDGINDVREAGSTGSPTLDANGDGQADSPVNGNGVPGSVPATGLTPPDTDGDGKPDFRDLDSDNDAINDVIEGGAGSFPDANGDGIVDGADTDGDGIKDPVDGRAGFGDANDPAPTNSDTDAIPDFRDPDSDNDGVTDLRESGVTPTVDANNDGKVDDITDPDNDGIPAPVDGLPAAFGDANNPALPDGNNNGKPDYRDPAVATPTSTPTTSVPTPTNTPVGPTATPTSTPTTGTAQLGNRVWNDANRNGLYETTEVGVQGVTITLLSGCTSTTTVLGSRTSDVSGYFGFANLAAGQYRLRVTNLPANFVFTLQNQGTNNSLDSDVNPTTGLSDCITLAAGQTDNSWDTGIYLATGPTATPTNTAIVPTATNTAVVPTATSTATAVVPTPTNTPVGPTATPTSTPATGTAQLGNRVWNDANRNGILETSEAGVQGVTITLLSGCTSTTTVLGSRTSDASGYFGFANLAAGQYRFWVTNLPANFVFTLQNQGTNNSADSDINPTTGLSDCITLAAGQTDNSWDTGIYLATGPTATPTATVVGPTPTPTSTSAGTTAQLGNRVWFDANRNGILETTETGAPGVTIALLSGCSSTTVLASRTSDASGYFGFANLAPGQYRLRVSNLPAGYIFSPQNQGASEGTDSDVDPVTGISDCVTLAAGQINNNVDAGIMPWAPQASSVGDRVWLDTNGDGIANGTEGGVPNVNVTLLSSCTGNAIVASTTTNSSGLYSFPNLAAGQYRIQVNLPAGYGFSLQNQGTDDAIDSDVNPASSLSDCITLGTSQSDMRWDVGLKSTTGPGTAAIGDRIWEDLNHDGIQDSTEPGLSGAKVGLYSNGTLLLAQVADAGGNFLFPNLAPGNYYLCFQQPVSPLFYALTIPLQGTNPALDSNADPSTGCTTAFTLGAGQLDRTRDAGFFDPPTTLARTAPLTAVNDPEIDAYLVSMGTEAEETVGEETVEVLHRLYLPVVTQVADGLDAATLSDATDTAVIERTSGDEASTVLEIGAEVELLHRLYLPVVTQQ